MQRERQETVEGLVCILRFSTLNFPNKFFPQISKRRDDLETVRRRQREARKERRRLEQEEGQGVMGGGGMRDADYLEELAR